MAKLNLDSWLNTDTEIQPQESVKWEMWLKIDSIWEGKAVSKIKLDNGLWVLTERISKVEGVIVGIIHVDVLVSCRGYAPAI